MNKNTTKKSIVKDLETVTDINGCKGLLRAIKSQEKENNKIIARNARLIGTLDDDEEDFKEDLKNSTEIRENWNIGLGVARELVFNKMDDLL